EVLREELALAHGVLRVRHAHAGDAAATEVGNGADVAGAPDVGNDHAVFSASAEGGTKTKKTALLKGKVGVAEHGLRYDARGPDDRIGLEHLARRGLDATVDRRGELRLVVHLGAALLEVVEHPVARLERDLGHDAVHRLDEVEM